MKYNWIRRPTPLQNTTLSILIHKVSIQSIIQQDPHYIRERRRELSRIVTAFSKQLAHVLQYMPAPTRILDLKTGEWTIVNDEKWQQLIDKIVSQQQDYLKKEFPEFYTP